MNIASTCVRWAAAGLLGILAATGVSPPGYADNAPPAGPSAPAQAASPAVPTPNPSAQPPAAPGSAAPPPGAAQTPAPGSPDAARPAEGGKPNPEASTGETVLLAARPFAFIEGKADRDEVYAAIQGSLGLVRRDMDKAGLKPAGRPLAVFVESDDTGFRYHAGYPLEAEAAGRPALSEAVKIGVTPGGKAMRFQHLGPYADIDATYDAITAYLDEKGIDAQDAFIEEYANDVKDADDPNLEVDIFVLLK